jgi:hypothetical protein
VISAGDAGSAQRTMLAAGRFEATASATGREGGMVKDIIRRIVEQMFDMRRGGNLGTTRGRLVTEASKDVGKWKEYACEEIMVCGEVDPCPRHEEEGTASEGYVKDDLSIRRS